MRVKQPGDGISPTQDTNIIYKDETSSVVHQGAKFKYRFTRRENFSLHFPKKQKKSIFSIPVLIKSNNVFCVDRDRVKALFQVPHTHGVEPIWLKYMYVICLHVHVRV